MGGYYTFELLDGETLATISFEEFCAFGLSGGGESFRLPPGWNEPGKAAAVDGARLGGLTGADDRSFFALFLWRGAIELLDLSFSPDANPRKFSSATLVESPGWIVANLYPKTRSNSTIFRDNFPSPQSGAIQSYFFTIWIHLSQSNIT